VYSPDVLPVTDHTGSAPVETRSDESRYLLTLRVSNALLGELESVDAVDSTGQDDESPDVGLLVGLDDLEVDVPVESGGRKRVDEEKGRFG
jgi:hypothetical protein